MYYFIYIIFGVETEKYEGELIYSLLSLHRVACGWSKKNIGVLIYTRQAFKLPEVLDDFQITFNLLKDEEVSAWLKQANNHVFILKPMILLQFFKKYQSCGIIIDTDTFFVKDPRPILKKLRRGYFLMHIKEFPVTLKQGVADFFRKKRFKRLNGDSYIVNPNFYIWNAGIVGMNPKYITLLPEIIYAITQISSDEKYPEHERWFIEQISFSFTLQTQKQKLLSAERYIVHYWFLKRARYFIAFYFNFFYGSDKREFEEILREHKLSSKEVSVNKQGEVPFMLLKLLKKFNKLRSLHFDSLPSNTYIGKALRNIQR